MWSGSKLVRNVEGRGVRDGELSWRSGDSILKVGYRFFSRTTEVIIFGRRKANLLNSDSFYKKIYFKVFIEKAKQLNLAERGCDWRL